MFTWICPKCGREVPPAYSECPNCAAADVPQQPAAAAPPAAPPAPETAKAVPPPIAPSPARSFDLPPSASFLNVPPPPPKKGLHGALVTVLVAAGIVAVLAGAYFLLGSKRGSAEAKAPIDPADRPVVYTKSTHPLAKYLELVGLRVKENSRSGMDLQFIIVNHSGADLPELKMNIRVKSDKKDIFDFPFTVPSIGPYESKDFSVPMKTSLKPYELPDWQYLRADFDITSAP